MKKAIPYLILLLIAIESYSQTTPIPDPVFESILISMGIDTNGMTGNILNMDAEGVTNLIIRNMGISDLSGIEAFVDLVMLDCEDNLLTSLDLTFNTKLNTLDCHGNQLSSLNIQSNTMLQTLACMDNQLNTIDLSKNLLLSDLSCQGNLITELDLTNNTELFQIVAHDNNLTAITFPSTQNLLQIVWCYNNQLESIDLTNAPILATLRFENNNLNFLDLRNANNNAMHTMDARNNQNLQFICVDDVNYSNSASLWNKDVTASYSTTCTLSIHEDFLTNINVHPNPVRNILNVGLTNNEEIKKIEIYSVLGQLKSIETTSAINFSNYKSGVYFLRIRNKRGASASSKIIKF